MQPIANILHQDTIRRLSTDGAFERGKAYFQEGRVVELARKDGSVVAKVKGTESYEVRIWMHEDSLAYACSCPMGQERWFCKHAVAVALAFVGSIAGLAAGSDPADPPASNDGRPSESAKAEPPKAESPKPSPVRAKPLAPAAAPAAPPKPAASAGAPPAPAATPASAVAPPVVAPAAAVAPRPGSLVDQLRGMSHEELLVFVLEAALDDEAFRARLVARLARGVT